MRGWPRGFDTATLIDTDVHDHGAWLHRSYHRLGDEVRCLGPPQQDAADNQIGIFDLAGNLGRLGQEEVNARGNILRELGGALGAPPRDVNGGSEAVGGSGRMSLSLPKIRSGHRHGGVRRV